MITIIKSVNRLQFKTVLAVKYEAFTYNNIYCCLYYSFLHNGACYFLKNNVPRCFLFTLDSKDTQKPNLIASFFILYSYNRNSK